ncbi:alpha/beta hydrolase, partial [Pseudomonas aeruginosa]|nr:alpha/beta hydrolase [Pseudomonas aeruginosa]
MAAKYPLSPAMWRFVEHSRAFASDSPRLDAQRAAYALSLIHISEPTRRS